MITVETIIHYPHRLVKGLDNSSFVNYLTNGCLYGGCFIEKAREKTEVMPILPTAALPLHENPLHYAPTRL
ncbi:hypothetical protein [Tengunoibacter tsumagoiensis]|uniref:hypothetical protein n=1 Tax=Tengunoibacter tsumagoiensis TaxID=2014871 RepID=UPI000F846350|nr:hypothetical protein [Tengunoibacter tsumagoiensis]